MRTAVLILILLMLLFGAAIGYFNAQTVSFNYLAGSLEVPLIVLIMIELIVIALIGLLVYAGRVWGYRREIRGLRKQLDAAQSELKNLRSLPLRDAG